MKVSHAEVKTPDGNTVWVHKCCENFTKAEFKILTANTAAYHGDIDGDFNYW